MEPPQMASLMISTETVLIVFASLVASYILSRWVRKSGRSLPLPPGPKGYPVIGNVYDLPRHYPWLTYSDWHRKYGDIFSFTVFGKTTIVLNSLKAATDLVENRSSNFSGRPRLIMADELLNWEWDFAHMSYTDRWRRHRRMFHQYFQPRNITVFYPFQKKSSITLLNQLVETPEDFISHIQQYVASISLHAAYGYEVKEDNDSYLSLVHTAIQPLLPVIHATRSFLVEFLPVLKHVPGWMPGAGFKRQALADADKATNMRDTPFNAVTTAMAEGVATRSFVCDNLEKIKAENPLNWEEDVDIVKNCAGIVYLAGSDTTVSLLTSWVLAMAHYPEVQKRAQEEIGKVVGHNRLPEFNDMDSLPYIEAMILETLRWRPVTPLALPHLALHDDVYDGYRIPAGSTVTVNAWEILHDEELYPDPFKFNPDRFLQDGNITFAHQPNPITAGGFGYGRRICPGRYLALNSARMAVASIVASYNIHKTVDGTGGVIEPSLEHTDGVISHPKPYQVKITPYSENSVKLIESAKLEYSA